MHAMNEIRIHKWRFKLPRSRPLRILLGILFIIGGFFGFLPILGFWMIPLGVMILSFEIPLVRRWRRRFVVWFKRWREKRQPARLRNGTNGTPRTPESGTAQDGQAGSAQ